MHSNDGNRGKHGMNETCKPCFILKCIARSLSKKEHFILLVTHRFNDTCLFDEKKDKWTRSRERFLVPSNINYFSSLNYCQKSVSCLQCCLLFVVLKSLKTLTSSAFDTMAKSNVLRTALCISLRLISAVRCSSTCNFPLTCVDIENSELVHIRCMLQVLFKT